MLMRMFILVEKFILRAIHPVKMEKDLHREKLQKEVQM